MRSLARSSSISPASPRAAREMTPAGLLSAGGWAGFSAYEIEHVELSAGVREEPSEVAHALEVSHVQGTAFVRERPVVALALRHADACGQLLGRWRNFDSFQDGTRRVPLQAACRSLPPAVRASARLLRATAPS